MERGRNPGSDGAPGPLGCERLAGGTQLSRSRGTCSYWDQAVTELVPIGMAIAGAPAIVYFATKGSVAR